VPLERLQLLEGQDLALVSTEELASGQVLSPRSGERRTLAPSLQEAVERLIQPCL
jgi:hypothetical protein